MMFSTSHFPGSLITPSLISVFFSSFLAAAFAKLKLGRTFGAKPGLGWPFSGTLLADFGELAAFVVPEAADTVLLLPPRGLRSVPARELVRDMLKRSFAASRSFSIRSWTSFSLFETSTGLAAPKGLAFDAPGVAVGPILGEERGLGLLDALPDLGISSNFRLPI